MPEPVDPCTLLPATLSDTSERMTIFRVNAAALEQIGTEKSKSMARKLWKTGRGTITSARTLTGIDEKIGCKIGTNFPKKPATDITGFLFPDASKVFPKDDTYLRGKKPCTMVTGFKPTTGAYDRLASALKATKRGKDARDVAGIIRRIKDEDAVLREFSATFCK